MWTSILDPRFRALKHLSPRERSEAKALFREETFKIALEKMEEAAAAAEAEAEGLSPLSEPEEKNDTTGIDLLSQIYDSAPGGTTTTTSAATFREMILILILHLLLLDLRIH